MLSSSNASSISFVKSPLPPISFKGRLTTLSPVVLITTISNESSGKLNAPLSLSRVSYACANARGEPLVPMRNGDFGSGKVSFISMV